MKPQYVPFWNILSPTSPAADLTRAQLAFSLRRSLFSLFTRAKHVFTRARRRGKKASISRAEKPGEFLKPTPWA